MFTHLGWPSPKRFFICVSFWNTQRRLDTIAPVTLDAQQQDEDEGCTNIHPDLNETFHHFSDNLGIPSSQENNEPLILNEMQDDKY